MNASVLETLSNQWDDLLKQGQVMTFRKGQVIFYEGHQLYGIFVLQEGDVKFSQREEPAVDSHRSLFRDEDVIGMDLFFNEAPSCCTCTAAKDCRVTLLSKTQLLPFFSLL